METLKNFIVGVLIIFAVIAVMVLAMLLWPILIGIGSLLFFVVSVLLVVALGFYIVVLVGHITRKGLKHKH